MHIFPVQVESVIEFEPGLESFTDYLMDMKSAQARVYLMYARLVRLRNTTFMHLLNVILVKIIIYVKLSI